MLEVWPSVSVVIRTFNAASSIRSTLTALVGQDYPGETEIILVDSGSTDGTLSKISGFPVRDLRYQTPYTPGGALNCGDSHARHPVLVHLSADAEPATKHYLKYLVRPMLMDDQVVATFGRDLPRSDAVPSQARDLATWFPDTGPLNPAERFSNANASVRREVWDEFPFDDKLSSTEDLHWARKVIGAGYRIVYAPGATVLHTHSSACREVFRRARRQRAAFYEIAPEEARFTAWDALRFWIGLSLRDLCYAVTKRYPARLWLHPFLFRGCQGWGLYRGARLSRG